MGDDVPNTTAPKRRWAGAKTYGRRDPVETSEILHSNPDSIATPSKPTAVTSDDEGDQESAPFVFSWRKKLEDLDNDVDDEAMETALRPSSTIIPQATETNKTFSSRQSTEATAVAMETSAVAGYTNSLGHNSAHSSPRSPPPHPLFQSPEQPESRSPITSPTPIRKSKEAAPHRKTSSLPAGDPESDDERPVARKSGKGKTTRIESPSDSAEEGRQSRGRSRPRANSDMEDVVEEPKSRRRSDRAQSSKPKIKKPTKKQIEEIKKESIRLHAGEHVSLERVTERLPVSGIFQRIAERKIPLPPSKNMPQTSSDPIVPFTSSPPRYSPNVPALSMSTSTAATKSSPLSPKTPPATRLAHLDGNFEPPEKMETRPSVPDISSLLLDDNSDLDVDPIDEVRKQAEERKRKEEEQTRLKKVRDMKMKYVQVKKEAEVVDQDDEDDDLEIEKPHTVLVKTTPKTKGTKAHMLALIGRTRPKVEEESQLEVSAGRHGFGGDNLFIPNRGVKDAMSSPLRFSGVSKRKRAPITQQKLNEKVLQKAAIRARREKEEKEAEWVKRGGKLKREAADSGLDLVAVAKKGLANAEKKENDSDDGEDDDDWNPDEEEDYRGSASPRSGSGSEDEWDGEIPRDSPEVDGELPQQKANQRVVLGELPLPSDEDDDKENMLVPPPDDEDDVFLQRPQIQTTRRPKNRIVTDSDDEETIPSQPDFDEFPPPNQRVRSQSSGRIVLGELDLDLSTQRTIQSPEPEGEGLDLDSGFEADGFTQLFANEEPEAARGFAALRNTSLLDSTQPSQLLPAILISPSKKKENEEILREHAEAVMARPRPSQIPSPQKYLTDEGFLTQTKPPSQYLPMFTQEGPSVDDPRSPIARPRSRSPSFDHLYKDSQVPPVFLGANDTAFGFPPLQTQELEDQAPLRRIRRGPRRDDEESAEEEASNEDKPLPKTAFDILMNPANRPKDKVKDKGKGKMPLDVSEFIVDEAAESDEDGDFGLVTRKKTGDDDEEEEEGDDKVVEGLVDDTAMDEKTVAADAVLAKVHEQELETDGILLKKAEDLAEGKFRAGKRRNRGLGVDDDGDSDEDEEDSMRRRAMHSKKRRIDGDGLDALAQNPETAAFVKTYNKDLIDDDDGDFAYLKTEALDNSMDEASGEEDGGDQSEEDEEMEEGDRPTKKVSVHRIREELLKSANEKKLRQASPLAENFWPKRSRSEDAYDVDVVVVSVNDRVVPPTTSTTQNLQDVVDAEESWRKPREHHAPKDEARLQQWAREESQNKNYSTGRGAAVTGHATTSQKAKPKSRVASTSSRSGASKKGGSRVLEKMNSKKMSGFGEG